MRTAALTVASIVFLLASPSAHAQAPGMSYQPVGSSDTETVVIERYGLLLAAADGATLLAATATQSGEMFLAGYLLGSPIVHLAHGNTSGAVGSLALRVGLPFAGGLVGGLVGQSNCRSSDDEFLCGLGEIVVGIGLGMAAAIVIDYSYLGRKTRKERRPASLLHFGSLRANPDLGISKQGSMRLGLRGSW